MAMSLQGCQEGAVHRHLKDSVTKKIGAMDLGKRWRPEPGRGVGRTRRGGIIPEVIKGNANSRIPDSRDGQGQPKPRQKQVMSESAAATKPHSQV